MKNEKVQLGIVPPQSIPLEEAVLGAIMIDRNAIIKVLDVVNSSSFYKPSHGIVFSAFTRLFEKGQPIDLLTTTEELRRSGELESIGGPIALVELTNRVASMANIEHHARIIVEKAMRRSLKSFSNDLSVRSYDETVDVFDLLEKAEQGIFHVTQSNMKGAVSMNKALGSFRKALEDAKNIDGDVTGVPSGFHSLDAITSGWQNSDLVILAARPGMGKTGLALCLAKSAAIDYQKPAAIFSLEMSTLQLVQRLVSMDAEVSTQAIRSGNLTDFEWTRLNSSMEKLDSAPIYMDDTPALTIFEVRAKARRLKIQYNIGIIFVDYLQLMKGGDEYKRGNREQEVSAISRGLKALAKELDVPVIALSQLSRAVETRGGAKRPQLSDLRESGSLEQDADSVAFIYRPEYYGINEDEDGNSLKGIGEIIFAKNRHGPLSTVRLRFEGEFARFRNLKDYTSDDFAGLEPPPMDRIEPRRINDDNDIPF